MTQPPPAKDAQPRQWIYALLLVLLVAIAYLPIARAGFIWDDPDYVTENPTLRNIAGLFHIWFTPASLPQYYPLVHSTFWLEFHLWGLNPIGYHIDNVLFHALAAVLLWRLLLRLSVPGAWFAAALFALHPVAVESVAWVTERKNVLCAVFYFACALFCVRSDIWRLADGTAEETTAKKSSRLYAWAFLLFLCALWSKTVACSLPAAVLLVCWWKHGKITRRDVLYLVPFFAAGIGFGLLTAWLEKYHVGAHGTLWQQTFLERCLIAGRVPWFYAGKLLWPVNLIFIYPRWQIDLQVWWQWLFPAMTLAAVVLLWIFRNRIGRGPLVAVLFFLGTLFPALGFVNVYPMRFSFVADHFQYLACVGLLVPVAVLLSRLPRHLGTVVRAVVLIVFLDLIWLHIDDFHDLKTLWTRTLALNPGCAIAHNNLGVELASHGDVAGAETHYRAAIQLEPNGEEALSNLGVLLAQRGDIQQATELLDRAIHDAPLNPEIQADLGKVLDESGHDVEAVEAFQKAIRLKPGRAEFYYDLGSVLARMGKTDEAIQQFERALQLRPSQSDAENNLGLVLARESRYEEAVQHYNTALALNPAFALAHNNLGDALMRLRRVDEAVPHFQEALRIDTNYANAHFNLGNAFALQKKYDEAVAEFNEAVRLSPVFATAHRNLALALARLGRRDEAAREFQEVLRLNPDDAQARQMLQSLQTSP